MTVILATPRDWFASALEAVLEEEGYDFRRVASGEELETVTRGGGVDAVILDEYLEGNGTLGVVRRLCQEGPLSRDVPILVYSSGVVEDSRSADYLDAGAWDVLEEPVRSAYFLALLRRFLKISGRYQR